MTSLYFATALHILDEVLEIDRRFFGPVIEGSEIVGVLGQGVSDGVVDHLGNGPFRDGRFQPQSLVNVWLKIDGGTFWITHDDILTSKRFNVKTSFA